jgi:hypothetical protein
MNKPTALLTIAVCPMFLLKVTQSSIALTDIHIVNPVFDKCKQTAEST